MSRTTQELVAREGFIVFLVNRLGPILGRCRRHRHDYLNLEKERTLGQHRVFQWLARFPDWSMDADLLLELPEPLPGERAPCGMDKLIHSIGGPLKDEELK